MKNSERAQALTILVRLIQKQHSLHQSLQDPTLSPFTKTLCFGFARHYYRLVAIADHMVDKRPKELSIWIGLLLGILQISVLKLPDYAVVQETVALLPSKQAWAKGFVNAILRRFCREQDSILEKLATNPDFMTMHPAWFVKKIKSDWPQAWQSILEANNTHPPMSLRVNLSHLSREAYCARMDEQQIAYKLIPHTAGGLILEQACAVHDLPGFAAGDISVQDGAAQLAGPLLELQPGLRVLDACCAPGGKLGQILELEPNLDACVGLDIDAQRLQRVQENCTRLGLQPTLHAGDALSPPSWWDGQKFDRILVDAPCSATGIIRRHPDIKLLRSVADVNNIAEIQKQIFATLWPLLAPGGLLVYATCSIMPDENTRIIAHCLSLHPDAYLDTNPQPWGHSTGNGWQVLPGEHDMDGFFYAKIRKKIA
jgi:16S rRNA (cytosine967-C5)-methyltransferase